MCKNSTDCDGVCDNPFHPRETVTVHVTAMRARLNALTSTTPPDKLTQMSRRERRAEAKRRPRP